MIGKQPTIKIWLVIIASLLPFLWLLVGGRGSSLSVLAQVSGLIGVILLLWQFILGGPYFSHYFTKDVANATKTHMFLGVYGTLFVLLHPVLVTLSLRENWSFLYRLEFGSSYEQFVSLGRISVFLFLLIWITSRFFRQKLGFKVWKKIHFLTYPLLLMAFVHATKIGKAVNTPGFLYMYWLGLWGLFLLILASRVVYFINQRRAL